MTSRSPRGLPQSTPRDRIDLGPAFAPPSDFDALVSSLGRWYVEFRAGRRSADQLRSFATTGLQRRLSRRAGERGPAPALQPVVRVIVQSQRSDVVEAVALVRTGSRTTALAVTLVHDGTRWWCSELTAPEDGELPTVVAPPADPQADSDAA